MCNYNKDEYMNITNSLKIIPNSTLYQIVIQNSISINGCSNTKQLQIKQYFCRKTISCPQLSNNIGPSLQSSTYRFTMSQTVVTWQELEKHIHFYDCWIVIAGFVYNVSDFLVEHPGGDSVLVKHSGRDATAGFEGLPHSEYAISLRNSKLVGKIESAQPPAGYLQRIEKAKKQSEKKQKKKLIVRQQKISPEQVALHKSQQNCWIILQGKVYDCTDYLEQHPGGVTKIMEWAGKDGTKAFRDANHSMSALKIRDLYYIGDLQKSKVSLILILLLVIIGIGAYVFLK